MIKENTQLDFIYEPRLPADEIRGAEVVMNRLLPTRQAVCFISNPTKTLLGFGMGGDGKLYNLEKCQEDNIPVFRRRYGGSGSVTGPEDIVFCLHINKSCLVNGHETNMEDLNAMFQNILCKVVSHLGVDCKVVENDTKITKDGVCAHLHGSSEVVLDNGDKMVATIFGDDEFGFYMNGQFINSNSWAKIYDYLKRPPEKRMPVNSIEQASGRPVDHTQLVNTLNQELSAIFDVNTTRRTPLERELAQQVKDRYRLV